MSNLRNKSHDEIMKVFERTGSIRGTAREVGVSRNKVRRHLRSNNATVEPRKGIKKPSKLDPYRAKISYLIKEKQLTGVRVLEEIKELGYNGGYTQLKNYIRTIRPKKQRGPTAPIDHQPGYEAQMDWSPHRVILNGRQQLVHTGSLVLCFSRWICIHFSFDEQIDSVIYLHTKAFNELNGVPKTITYDNMTTVGFHKGPGDIWINPKFKAFADQYGFEVIILRPGSKDRHGIVERPFHYIEHNYIAGREFSDLEELNLRADKWRSETANLRIHGTLRERPSDRLKRELPFLIALPYDIKNKYYRSIERLVHRDFCVIVDTNRYSVNPDLVGTQVEVRLYQDHLEIWTDKDNICSHTYNEGKYQRQVLAEHENAYKDLTCQSKVLENAFIRLGDTARSYYEGLKRYRGKGAGYHLQRIIKLADRYGSDIVQGAMAYSQRYGVYSSEAVLRVILGKGLQNKGKVIPQTLDIPENIRQFLRAYSLEDQELDAYDQIVSNTNEK